MESETVSPFRPEDERLLPHRIFYPVGRSDFSRIIRLVYQGRENILQDENRLTKVLRPNLIRILLVDDNSLNLRLTTIILSKAGFTQVETAGNGTEALAAVVNGHFDLILMDLWMPEMNGMEATRKIRDYLRNSGRNQKVLIVSTTTAISKTEKEMCLKAGMDLFLPKPFPPGCLENVICQHFPWLWEDPAEGRKNTPMLDPQRIQTLRELAETGGQNLLPQLFDLFLQQAEKIIRHDIPSALQAESPSRTAALRTVFHRLNGSSVNVGAASLSAFAQNLEATTREVENIPDGFTTFCNRHPGWESELYGLFNNTRTEIEKMLAET
jgi:CheY-like chemotaxis protein